MTAVFWVQDYVTYAAYEDPIGLNGMTHLDGINKRMEANGVTWQPCSICARTWPWPVGFKCPADYYVCPICCYAGLCGRSNAPSSAAQKSSVGVETMSKKKGWK